MKEFTALCAAGGLVVGGAVLALSVAAKLMDQETTRVAWPVTGGLRVLAGPAQVTAVEGLVAVTALLPVPAGPRLGLLGAVFTVYTIAALLMRGRRCGCFGSWIPARFTAAHAAGCAVIAALAFTGALGPPRAGLACAEAGAGLALAVVAAAWLRRRSRAAGRVEPPAEVRRIVIFTAESCRYCAALEAQRERYEAMAACPVEFRRATTDEEVRAAGGAFPAAVAYGADGAAVSDAAHGLAAIRDLLRHSTTRSGRPESRVTT